ncbi:hypothetical protein [Sphingobium lactosutens]|uniref:hypothetical protein n=1 Tax=Sphingobium lactosutens TaxID=522773 RepID=UPI001D191F7B|nr:hypothetical protein [Sphingobium lactosutens]
MKSPPLASPMSAVTLASCRSLDRISEYAQRLREQCQLDEHGNAKAFGIDMHNPAHAEWLADIRDDLLILLHRAERVGDFAHGGREFDNRGPL